MATLDRRKDRFVEDQDKRVSVGIEFPLGRVGGGDGYFKSTKTTVESIKNNIRLLLQTHRGERVFQPNLGMDLRSLIFEPLTEDITIQIENNIVDKDDLNQVNINIDFNIRRAPNNLESVQVTFEGVGAGSSTSNGAY